MCVLGSFLNVDAPKGRAVRAKDELLHVEASMRDDTLVVQAQLQVARAAACTDVLATNHLRRIVPRRDKRALRFLALQL